MNFWFLDPTVLSKCMDFVELINHLYVKIQFLVYIDKISFFILFFYNQLLLLLVQELEVISGIQSVYVSKFLFLFLWLNTPCVA